jgi:hypothetical protein
MLPLLAAGTQGAASLLDRFAPSSYENVELFSRGNSTHRLLPFVVALGGAVLVYAVCRVAMSAPARRRHPGWAFAFLPPLVFAVQEHAEYIAGHGHVPWLLVVNPVFLAGLLLQAPFAIAAYAAARALVDVAVAIVERWCGARVVLRRRPPVCARPGGTRVPRRLFVNGRTRTRGPPFSIAA